MKRVPTNSSGLAALQKKKANEIPFTNVVSRRVQFQLGQQINPIAPVRPNDAWSKDNTRGFGMDDLNTYTIRRSDAETIAQFDRHVLKDELSLFGDRKRITLGALMKKRLGDKATNRHKSGQYIKHAYRNNVKGQASANVATSEKQLWDNYRMYS